MEKLSAHAAILLALLAAAPARAVDFPLAWHWIRVTPSDTKGWEVQRGARAEVTLTQGGFTAKLYDDDAGPAGDADIFLKARNRGGRVTADAVQLDTDTGHWTLHGTITHDRTQLGAASSGWGEDRIALTAGSEYIGLARQVRSGAPGKQE